MTMQIVIQVPDRLGKRLEKIADRLPALLEQLIPETINEITPPNGHNTNIDDIIATLSSRPTPEQILALQPSPALQNRVSELLAKNKTGILSRDDETELDRYLMVEHLVRLAKAYAYQHLSLAE
jgi:hypothetical protein